MGFAYLLALIMSIKAWEIALTSSGRIFIIESNRENNCLPLGRSVFFPVRDGENYKSIQRQGEKMVRINPKAAKQAGELSSGVI